MTESDLSHLPELAWMPSRIPVRDALAASIPKGTELPQDRIPPSAEQRWYPQADGSLRLLVPYDGAEFDSRLFHIEPRAWDHSTCVVCTSYIAAMTVCYVTREGPYMALCCSCYRKHVVNRLGLLARVRWYAGRWVGRHAAA